MERVSQPSHHRAVRHVFLGRRHQSRAIDVLATNHQAARVYRMQIGFMAAIPYIVGCVGTVAIGFLSDRFKQQKVFLIAALLLLAGGLWVL
ncbi:hypothetical protein D3C76_1558810 [compost metagenome]